MNNRRDIIKKILSCGAVSIAPMANTAISKNNTYEQNLLKKWQPILDYNDVTSKNITEHNKLACARKLEDVEIWLRKNTGSLILFGTYLIPFIRRTYSSNLDVFRSDLNTINFRLINSSHNSDYTLVISIMNTDMIALSKSPFDLMKLNMNKGIPNYSPNNVFSTFNNALIDKYSLQFAYVVT